MDPVVTLIVERICEMIMQPVNHNPQLQAATAAGLMQQHGCVLELSGMDFTTPMGRASFHSGIANMAKHFVQYFPQGVPENVVWSSICDENFFHVIVFTA